MGRRVRHASALAAALLAATASAAVAEVTAPARPNIIYILTDDLGYADIGCFGQTRVATPNLDKMASQGLRFTNHYAAAPVCAAARCMLFTGKHAGHARVRSNGSDKLTTLRAEDLAFPQLLRKAGYATACIGKWDLGKSNTTGSPEQKGFDHFYGFLDQVEAHNHYPPALDRDGRRIELPANKDGRQGDYADDLFTADAITYLGQQRDKPFFLYLPYTLPHAEIAVPESSLTHYAGKWEETPFPGRHYRVQKQPRAARAGMINRLDHYVGEVFDELAKQGLEKNTLVIFASDNGPATAGGADPEFFQSAGPLSGLKFSLEEGGIRVPMIAHWPGVVPAGITSDLTCTMYDMFPTLTAIAGIDCPAGLDGISIAPTLMNNAAAQQQHEFVYFEYHGAQAVRFGQYKAISAAPGQGIQLFDLKADIGEKNNVAADHPELVSQAAAHIKAAHSDDANWPLKANK